MKYIHFTKGKLIVLTFILTWIFFVAKEVINNGDPFLDEARGMQLFAGLSLILFIAVVVIGIGSILVRYVIDNWD